LSEEFAVHLGGFQPGTLLAGYRLEAQIGAGGMAVVFRARDERLGRPVALKIMAPALAADRAYQRRFIAESRAAARVDDPHIIPIYEAGEAGGVLFIAMRFVQGGDLGNVLEQEGALPPDRAAGFISQVASALDAAHGAGLVHRDVKPANILVDARAGRPDHAYLSDFGASKGAMLSSVSVAGGLTGAKYVGTPYYSSPEQIDGLPVDGSADQYALACVAFQLLTGRVPFERDQPTAVLLAHLSAPRPSLVERRSELPGAVDPVVAKAMAKRPADRYESCGDFADALREALGLTPYHARGPLTAHVQPPPTDPPSDVSPVVGPPTQTAMRGSAPSRTAAATPPAPLYPATQVPATPPAPLYPATQVPATPPASLHPETQVAAATPPAPPPTVVSAPGQVLAPAPEHPSGEVDEDAGILAPSATAVAGEDVSAETPDVAEALEVPAEAPDVVAEALEVPAEAPDVVAEAPDVAGETPDAPGVAADAPVVPTEIPDAADAPEPDSEGEAAPKVRRRRRGVARRPSSPSEIPPGAAIPSAPPPAAAVDSVPGKVLAPAPERSGSEAEDAGILAASDVVDVPAGGVITRPDGPAGEASDDAAVLARMATPVVGEDVAAAESEPTADLEAGGGSGELAPEAGGPAEASVATAEASVTTAQAPEPAADAIVTAEAETPQVAADAPDVAADAPDLAADAPDVAADAPDLAADAPDALDATVMPQDAPAVLDMPENAPEIPVAAAAPPAPVHATAVADVAEMPTAVVVAPLDRPEAESGGRTTTARVRRRRLAAVAAAAACVVVAAAVAIPLLLHSSPKPANSPRPGPRPSPVNFSRVALDLPSNYKNGFVSSLAFSPTSGTLAIAHRSGGICLWDMATKGCTVGLAGAWSVAFSPDGKTLAAGDANSGVYASNPTNGIVRLWNVVTGKSTATFTDPSSQGALSLAFSPDGKTLAVGDRDGATYLWNVATGKLVRAPLIDPNSQGINGVAFSPDGKTLAVSDVNGCTYLWSAATGKPITTLIDPSSQGVNAVAFSLDGQTLATGDDNGHIYLWNAVTWKRTAAFKDPDSKGADSVAFSPDGKTLAVGDVNGCTYVWTVATGKPAHAALIDPNSEGINAVLFSPNGKTLATGDEDGDVYVW
jgi:serine/threonine protein kinase